MLAFATKAPALSSDMGLGRQPQPAWQLFIAFVILVLLTTVANEDDSALGHVHVAIGYGAATLMALALATQRRSPGLLA